MSLQINLTLYPSGLPVQDAGAFYTPYQKTFNWSVAQSDTTIWDVPATKRAHLLGVSLSTDTAQTIEIEDENNNDVIPPVFAVANGNACITGEGEIWMGASGINLTLTSSQNGNLSCMIWGYQEGSQ